MRGEGVSHCPGFAGSSAPREGYIVCIAFRVTSCSMNGILSHRTAGAHPVDLLVAWAASRSKLFSRGWGDEKLLAELSGCGSYSDAPGPISVKWETASKR